MNPVDVELLLDQAEDALQSENFELTLELCQRVMEAEPGYPGALFLVAETWRALGQMDTAEAHYRAVLAQLAGHSASWSALGTVYFDTLRLDEAANCALRAIREDPDNSEGYYLRALLRERRGDYAGSDRDYLQASILEPDLFPLPVRLDDAAVEAVVESALRALDPSIQDELSMVTILLDELPDRDICDQFQPSSPSEILGVFTGMPVSERSVENPWSQLPAGIVIFRRNLERFAWDRDALIEQLRITLFHEIGHHLGLSEEDLEDRGLD
ncbi:MAG: metallopeptidase family protein [Deltaproteobacteria bacterium]|nr:metallopeptidase family protein [Deltaproteobacteria bacterium]